MLLGKVSIVQNVKIFALFEQELLVSISIANEYVVSINCIDRLTENQSKQIEI